VYESKENAIMQSKLTMIMMSDTAKEYLDKVAKEVKVAE
jgi:hypothetical protein